VELFKAHFTVPSQGLRLIYAVQGAQLAHIAIRLCTVDGQDLNMIGAIDLLHIKSESAICSAILYVHATVCAEGHSTDMLANSFLYVQMKSQKRSLGCMKAVQNFGTLGKSEHAKLLQT